MIYQVGYRAASKQANRLDEQRRLPLSGEARGKIVAVGREVSASPLELPKF